MDKVVVEVKAAVVDLRDLIFSCTLSFSLCLDFVADESGLSSFLMSFVSIRWRLIEPHSH